MEKYWENRGGWCRLGCWMAYIVAYVYQQSHFVSIWQQHCSAASCRPALVQKSAKRHTHFCVAGTGISAARTTLLLNAAPSSSISCASAMSPWTISHLGESGIHLWQLNVFVFIFRVIKTLMTLRHSSCTTCFGRFGHHQVDSTTNMVTYTEVYVRHESRVTAVTAVFHISKALTCKLTEGKQLVRK